MPRGEVTWRVARRGMDAAYVGAAVVSELGPSGACLHVGSTFCSDHSYLSMSARGEH